MPDDNQPLPQDPIAQTPQGFDNIPQPIPTAVPPATEPPPAVFEVPTANPPLTNPEPAPLPQFTPEPPVIPTPPPMPVNEPVNITPTINPTPTLDKELEASLNAVESNPASNNDKKKKYLIISGAVILIGIIGYSVFAFMGSNDPATPAPTEQNSNTLGQDVKKTEQPPSSPEFEFDKTDETEDKIIENLTESTTTKPAETESNTETTGTDAPPSLTPTQPKTPETNASATNPPTTPNTTTTTPPSEGISR